MSRWHAIYLMNVFKMCDFSQHSSLKFKISRVHPIISWFKSNHRPGRPSNNRFTVPTKIPPSLKIERYNLPNAIIRRDAFQSTFHPNYAHFSPGLIESSEKLLRNVWTSPAKSARGSKTTKTICPKDWMTFDLAFDEWGKKEGGRGDVARVTRFEFGRERDSWFIRFQD